MEKVQDKMAEEVEEQVDVKILMIGGNDAEMAGAVIKALEGNADGATIYELDNDEMQIITNRRMNRATSEAMTDYIDNEENKRQALVIATEFHKRWKNDFWMGYFSCTLAKSQTTMSWSRFNEVMATLDLFGYVDWENDKKKAFKIVLKEEEIIALKKKETQAMLDLAKGKLLELKEMNLAKAEKAKLDTMIKKMKLTV